MLKKRQCTLAKMTFLAEEEEEDGIGEEEKWVSLVP